MYKFNISGLDKNVSFKGFEVKDLGDVIRFTRKLPALNHVCIKFYIHPHDEINCIKKIIIQGYDLEYANKIILNKKRENPICTKYCEPLLTKMDYYINNPPNYLSFDNVPVELFFEFIKGIFGDDVIVLSESSKSINSDKITDIPNKSNSNLISFKNQISSSFKEVVYRKSSRKLISKFRKLLLDILSSSDIEHSSLNAIKAFLATKYGEATISFMIGTIIPNIPNINNNDKLIKISKEMRINGLEVLFEFLFNKQIIPLFSNILDQLNSDNLD